MTKSERLGKKCPHRMDNVCEGKIDGKLGKVVLLAQREPAVYPKEMLGFCNEALDVLLSGILFYSCRIRGRKMM